MSQRLSLRKEELFGRNYVVARDGGTCRRELKILKETERKYFERLSAYEQRQEALLQRCADFRERHLEVRRQAKDTRRREREVEAIEQRLDYSGKKVSGALGESQVELETLDLVAGQWRRSGRGRLVENSLTLEESLSRIIDEGESRRNPN
jgi:uncharacterized protein (DUF3084 family)